MPIANCIVAPDISKGEGDLLALWAECSGKSASHMTVNLLSSQAQFGNPYAVVANLYLPSLWSAEDVSALQLGLAKSLAEYFKVDIERLLVMTHIIDSGRVVDAGQEVVW